MEFIIFSFTHPLRICSCHVSAWMYSRCWDLTLTPCRVLSLWEVLHRHRTRWCFYPSSPPQSHSCFKPSAGIWVQSNQRFPSFLLLSPSVVTSVQFMSTYLSLSFAKFWSKTQWKDCKRWPITNRWRQQPCTQRVLQSYRNHKISVCLNSQHLSPASADIGSALPSGSQQVQMARCILQSDCAFMTLKCPVIYWTM